MKQTVKSLKITYYVNEIYFYILGFMLKWLNIKYNCILSFIIKVEKIH